MPPQTRQDTTGAQLKISTEEARRIAGLLRYAVSLNTTVGLLSPSQRRLATTTYRAIELAALVLEGKTFDEAVEESNRTWTGSLEEDHRRALELLDRERDALRQAMSSHLTPEQITEFLEITQEQFLELTRPAPARREETQSTDS